ncbi:MAG: DUF3078 domain-containing protein [Flavobacteriaceae bacterium]|nr:DUF3078 domain-containing protein [Flavobacteriaceae bacterium]
MLRIKKIILLSWLPVLSFAQESPLKKSIDSLVQSKWKSSSINLDSLNSPKLVDLKIKKKDTIILKVPQSILVEEDYPVTPFSFMNTFQERKWFVYGQNNLQFNQSAFSNWSTGGNNSIGVIGKVNYSISYKNKAHFWDNNIRLGYGMLSISGRELRKTEDQIYISSKYGYDLGSQYYFLMGAEFSSQFSAGYNYSSSKKRAYEDRISRFMAPAYLNSGIGILYNPNPNFQVSLSPINTKFTFVLDELLQKKGKFGLVRDGQSIRTEVGALINAVYRIRIYKDIHWVNQLNLFSNYAFRPDRIDIAYSSILTMKFNKFISTTFNLDLVYDHDQIKNLQVKQTLGVGISYHLGVENKEKNTKKDKVKIFL